jgi:integrase/recombinase XerC
MLEITKEIGNFAEALLPVSAPYRQILYVYAPNSALILSPASVGDDPRVAAAFARILADLGSPESLRAYRAEWERFCTHLAAQNVAPLSARTIDVQTYLLGLRAAGKKASTRARALSVIRAVYAALAREGLVQGNPAREAKNPKGDPSAQRTPWLTAEELTQFLAAVPADASFRAQRDYLISMTLAMTGLRRAEVARIAVEDFEADASGERQLRVRAKGAKYGTIQLVAPLAHALDAWCASQGITSGPIFRRAPNSPRPVSTGTIRNVVRRQAARAGFRDVDKFAPHAFRRTLATLADQRGVAKEVIQRGLLHSKSTTTERYMKLGHAPKAPADAFVDLLPEGWRR